MNIVQCGTSHATSNLAKVQRTIGKREREGTSEWSPNVEKRHRRESMKTGAGLFCQEENEMLLKFKTTDANDNVKQMAIDLQKMWSYLSEWKVALICLH